MIPSEYKEGRGDYYLAEGLRERRASLDGPDCGRCGHGIWSHADDVGCRVRVDEGRPVQGGRDLCPCVSWSPPRREESQR